MYKMSHFTESDHSKVLDFMKAHPFVTLIGHNSTQNVATQIPVLFDENRGKLSLRAHIMRNTDHHKALIKNPDVLVLFTGPHCYVSSSWYTERMGATWNYQTVHVKGKIDFLTDDETIHILKELTEQYESGQDNPLFIDKLPKDYIPTLVKAIAGIRITIEDIYPIFKLSQNRDDDSYRNIVKQLEKTNDCDAHKIAREMTSRRPGLFK